jgi:hypothetical protein
MLRPRSRSSLAASSKARISLSWRVLKRYVSILRLDHDIEVDPRVKHVGAR